MGQADGLICAYRLDGRGTGHALGWDGLRSWRPGEGVLWVHLDRSEPASQAWLRNESGIEPLVCDALLAEETRPRCVSMTGGLVLNLRGVNLHPEADPEDMVSIRMWAEADRVITVRHQRLMAVQDVRDALESGKGPRNSADLVVQIGSRLIDRMGPVIDELEEGIDDLEERILTVQSRQLRTELAALRRQAIALRRYIAPQRDALSRLQQEDSAWLTPAHRARVREVADRVTRHVEDLDAARERAAVTQEELMGRLSEQMNKTMYLLAVVAAVFMPLGLLTGLLGINVAGIPGAEYPWAFAIVCVSLVGVVVVELILLRLLKWM